MIIYRIKKSIIQYLNKSYFYFFYFFYLVRHNALDNSPMRCSKKKNKIKSSVSESNSGEKNHENILSGGILINGHNNSQLSISNNNGISSNFGSSHNNSNNNINLVNRGSLNTNINSRNNNQNNNNTNNNNSNNNNNNVNYEQNMRDFQNRDSQNREYKELPVGPLMLPSKKNEHTFQKKVHSPRPYNNYTEPPMRERTLSSSTSDSTCSAYL